MTSSVQQFLPPWLSWVLRCLHGKRGRTARNDPTIRASREARYLPPDVDLQGRKPLTRPSSPTSTSTSKAETFLASTLHVLPLEIRQRIWEYVFGGETYHLEIRRQRFIGTRCTSDPETLKLMVHDSSPPRKHKQMLSLLLTGRRLYSEAIEFLYSANHFEFNENVARFLPSILLPQRINNIHSANVTLRLYGEPPLGPDLRAAEVFQQREERRLNDWVTIWHNLAAMSGLRNLCVELQVTDIWWSGAQLNSGRSVNLLKPIQRVMIPRSFTLVLPFPAIDGTQPWMVAGLAHKDRGKEDPWEALHCTIERRDPPK